MKKLLSILAVVLLGTCTSLAEGTCSNATLKGGYGALLSGEIFGSQVVGIADVQFNGDGTFHQTVSLNNANGVVLSDLQVDGTYFVNEDCTGQYTHPVQGGTVTAKFVIVDNGKEYRLVTLTPNNRLSGTGKRK